MNNDLIFFSFDEVETEVNTTKEIILMLNAKPQENFIKESLGQEHNYTIVTTASEAKQAALKDRIDLVIALRKSKRGGVEDPIKMVEIIKNDHPEVEAAFIVGYEDEIGLEMIAQAKEIGAYTISHPSAPISAQDILVVIDEIKQGWKVEVSSTPNNLILVESAKGGAGSTTVAISIAAAAEGKKTLLIDQKGGIRSYFYIDLKQTAFLDQAYALNEHIDYLFADEVTSRIIEDACEKYDLVILDDVKLAGKLEVEYKHLLVINSTAEALMNAKEKLKEDSLLIYNASVSDILPAEVVAHELKKVFHERKFDFLKYLQAAASSEFVPNYELYKKLI